MTQRLKAIYEGGVFRPLEPVQLADHQVVTLLLETPDEAQPRAETDKPIWEFAAELVRDIPQGRAERSPYRRRRAARPLPLWRSCAGKD